MAYPMESKFINLKHSEYIDIYSLYKDLLNPDNLDSGSGFVTRCAHMRWHELGLKYYETDALGKWFEVLDRKKWMNYLMLMKIKYGI